MTAETTIAVFAKAPIPGEVKTRLMPLLGPQGAAELARRMIERALTVAAAAKIGPLELWVAGNPRPAWLYELAARKAAPVLDQRGGHLGSRMGRAFAAMLSPGSRALLIGSDCPALEAEHLIAAARALEDHDAVFIPAEDGGYVAIGLTRFDARVFGGIAWGSADVMAQTRSRLAELGWRWRELPALWDVDRPEDVERLRRELPELVRGLT